MNKVLITVVVASLMFICFVMGLTVSAINVVPQKTTKKQLQNADGYGIPTVDLQAANAQLQPAQEAK